MGLISQSDIINSVEEGQIYKSNQLRFFSKDYRCMLVEEGVPSGLQGDFFCYDDKEYIVVKVIQNAFTYMENVGRNADKIIVIKKV